MEQILGELGEEKTSLGCENQGGRGKGKAKNQPKVTLSKGKVPRKEGTNLNINP